MDALRRLVRDKLVDLISAPVRALMQPEPVPSPHVGLLPFFDPLSIPRRSIGEVSSGPMEGTLLRCGGSLSTGMIRAVRLVRADGVHDGVLRILSFSNEKQKGGYWCINILYIYSLQLHFGVLETTEIYF